MMQTLRKYMKYIFWLVAIAFLLTIVLSWGMGGIRNRRSEAQQGVIGIINGQKIRYESFANAFEQEIEKTREESGGGRGDRFLHAAGPEPRQQGSVEFQPHQPGDAGRDLGRLRRPDLAEDANSCAELLRPTAQRGTRFVGLLVGSPGRGNRFDRLGVAVLAGDRNDHDRPGG